jgi:cation diffusion facilitator CzcD-associated flavoprotein CzcO
MTNLTGAIGPGPVAVIGAGPSGLTAAKHLIERGLEPVVLERGRDLGGQWDVGAPHSAVWPGMRTNTSRTTTAFSDFPLGPSVATFPSAGQVHAYLREYAEHFGVHRCIRTGSRVTAVERDGEDWIVRWSRAGTERAERFAGVVVASGRFGNPRFPNTPGLARLRSDGRVLHSMHYHGRDEFRGRRVLVYGNSISGVEIASDLAADDTIEVISACRHPRYVLQKVVRGVPTDWRWFTRFFGLLGAALPPEQVAAGIRDGVLAEAGDPATYGALAVDPEAPPKLSMSQEYLAYVAEGRIATRGAVEAVEGRTVSFGEGAEAEVDAVICATGYDLDVSFLSPEIRRVLGDDRTHLDLYLRTFHPDLPGLALLGQFLLIGPQIPTAELQARWVAAVWSGALAAPRADRMWAGIVEHRAVRQKMPFDMYPQLAAMLAAELGVEPDVGRYPELVQGLLFGPLAPARWLLEGPGARPEAERLLARAFGELGPLPPVAAEQIETLRMIAGALDDPGLDRAADHLEAELTAAPTPT